MPTVRLSDEEIQARRESIKRKHDEDIRQQVREELMQELREKDAQRKATEKKQQEMLSQVEALDKELDNIRRDLLNHADLDWSASSLIVRMISNIISRRKAEDKYRELETKMENENE
jgi:hypothetical protein